MTAIAGTTFIRAIISATIRYKVKAIDHIVWPYCRNPIKSVGLLLRPFGH